MTAAPAFPVTFRLQTAPGRGQSGRSSRIDALTLGGAGRGRSTHARRRVAVAPVISAHEARGFWASLLDRRSLGRDQTAILFGVTFQTACNWHDGFVVPTGDKVMTAIRLWPEEFLTEEGR